MTGSDRPPSARRDTDRFADGEWHRLHPATPLLRGGIVFIAVLGYLLSTLPDRVVGFFFGSVDYGADPLDEIYDRGWEGWALLAVAIALLVCVAAFYFSWRARTFRITGDAVEVRSGILFRTQRKARLDRIQGVNVVRPLFARIVGAAKLDITVAGQDANIQLAYLNSALVEGLRSDVLRLASGARAAEGAASGAATPARGSAGEFLNRRVSEFLAPELDPAVAPAESVVRIPPLRLLGSLLLSGFTVLLLGMAVVVGPALGERWWLIVLLPGLIGSASFYSTRFTKSLRYSIAGTPDGVRIGFGLLSTSSQTLPPGRIHAVEVLQPLLWRPFGWWRIRIDTAGQSQEKGAAGQANTTVLPVGDAADVIRVLRLVLPGLATAEQDVAAEQDALIAAGMTSPGSDDYTGSPRRAMWWRPLSWRRNGFRMIDGAILLRHGFIWRSLVIAPLARMQSVELRQGPLERAFRLSEVRFHTVAGPVSARLGAIDADIGMSLFGTVVARAIDAAAADRSHRWGASPSPLSPTPPAPSAPPFRPLPPQETP